MLRLFKENPIPPSQSIARAVRRSGQLGASLLLAHGCLGCEDRPVGTFPLCAACRRRLKAADPGDLDLVANTIRGLSGFHALWQVSRGNPALSMIRAVKYRNAGSLGRHLGRRLARSWTEAQKPVPDLIVPIPLHPIRVRERGYNQAELVAQGLAEVWQRPISTRVLRRSALTPSQTSLPRIARRDSLAGAFRVNASHEAAGMRIVLVDDVVTTGATLEAAVSALSSEPILEIHAASVGFTRSRGTHGRLESADAPSPAQR